MGKQNRHSLLLAVCCAFLAVRPVFALERSRLAPVIQVEEAGDTYWVEMTPALAELRERESVVAVALGGGGARAIVNVGVLKALEEEGIPIDLGEVRFGGDLHLYASLGKDGAHPWENEYCFTGELLAPLGGNWAFLSRWVLAETNYTPTPRIYRGFPAGDPPKYQAAWRFFMTTVFPTPRRFWVSFNGPGWSFFSSWREKEERFFLWQPGADFVRRIESSGSNRYI